MSLHIEFLLSIHILKIIALVVSNLLAMDVTNHNASYFMIVVDVVDFTSDRDSVEFNCMYFLRHLKLFTIEINEGGYCRGE